MTVIGTVDSLWRYPVKSMRGEELDEAFLGFPGLYGDRLFAFTSSAAPAGFPYFTGRDESAMLRYRPRFRDPARAARPKNLTEAESIGSGANPLYGTPEDLRVDVETPSGEVLAVNDPALVAKLCDRLEGRHTLTLIRSERAITDCRPISLVSLQTAEQLGARIGAHVDKRRFRANIYVNLESAGGFGEDTYVGESLRIGPKVTISVLQRDSRCKMITLDPDTAESTPELLREVASAHQGMAGVYAAVLVEGTVRKGDPIELLP
jgi:MOSC domain-containing protein